MSRQTCSGCEFWNQGDHIIWGQCRRHAPIAVAWHAVAEVSNRDGTKSILEMQTSGYSRPPGSFPCTKPDDWCGDHKPRVAMGAEVTK